MGRKKGVSEVNKVKEERKAGNIKEERGHDQSYHFCRIYYDLTSPPTTAAVFCIRPGTPSRPAHQTIVHVTHKW